MARQPNSCVLSVLLLFAAGIILPALAQTETGTIHGSVTDPTGALVANATVRLIDDDRGFRTEVATGSTGLYTLASVRPGHYRMEVEASGFKLVRLTGITLNVQDNVEHNFKLEVGSVVETITVEASAVNVNTTDGSVSTLVDNRFVENMPLNGRSFISLLDLTPGVVLTPSNFQEQGQFSVNGQRPDANYFTVDGVSANLGTSASVLGQGGGGQLPATSAFGGSNLVSLDALQEFRVQTSTFAPEYERTPGAQVSVVTKSGSNSFHGAAFPCARHRARESRTQCSSRVRRYAMGITLRRQFRLTENFSLQFRGDFFNLLNHPNFGSPINFMTSPQFGQATQTLNNFLGSGGQSGGLNPLYQIGGPRSIQLAMKLQF